MADSEETFPAEPHEDTDATNPDTNASIRYFLIFFFVF